MRYLQYRLAAAEQIMPTTSKAQPVIPAAKHPVGDELLYLAFGRRSLRRFFTRVWIQHDGPLPHPRNGPFIFYLNHSAWWDGYMMMVIHRLGLQRRFDSYLLMEERQLRAYRFFTWCGAFSINRNDPQDSDRSQTYAANLLQERRDRALYIFPQGRIAPNDQRPLYVYPGIVRIAGQVGSVMLVPITLRYEFLGQQWPHAFIRIGQTHRLSDPENIEASRVEIERRLNETVDALREDVLAQRLNRFRPLLNGQLGIDQRWDIVRTLWQGQ
jgi:chlorobactene lauroyltransferase